MLTYKQSHKDMAWSRIAWSLVAKRGLVAHARRTSVCEAGSTCAAGRSAASDRGLGLGGWRRV
jgi:hypothetical protein